MPKNKPNIKYKTIIINKRNVDAYHSGRTTMFRGEFYYDQNNIVIYRYKIAKNLGLADNDELVTRTQDFVKLEKETLVHEMKHFQNTEFGDQEFITTSYYEICGLKAFDEVSAFAAEHLMSIKQPTHIDVCYAVVQGIHDVVSPQTTYINRFMLEIQDLLHFNTRYFNKETAIQHIKQHLTPKKRPTKTFKTTVNNYLTFDGQGIYDSHNKIPNELKIKIKEFKQTYEFATTQALLKTLNKLQKTI